VIAIIGILVGMLLPAVQQVREAARNANCQSNIRNVALASLNFEAVKQRYPAGTTDVFESELGTSILVSILPQLEQQAVADILTDALVGATGVAEATDRLADNAAEVPIFICPSSTQSDQLSNDTILNTNINGAAAHYYGVAGPGDDINPAPGTFADFPQNDYFTLPETQGATDARFRVGMEGIFSPFTSARQSAAADNINLSEYSLKRSKTSSDLRDGTSNTLMFGEMSRSEGVRSGDGTPITTHRTAWTIGSKDDGPTTGQYSPDHLYGVNAFVVGLNERENYLARANDPSSSGSVNSQSFSSNHSGGVNFAYADGHINTLDAEIEENLLKRLSSIAGSESASDQGF
jgi:prepilin-type processing-associated H-X9-DG protein